MNIKTIIAAAALTLGATSTFAQEEGEPPRRPFPPIPVMGALDANKDGVIDASEIANAASALLTLDKNGDGQLTHEELRPARPDRPGGPRRPGGPGRPGPRDGEGRRGPRQ